jgi:hypothetical protein
VIRLLGRNRWLTVLTRHSTYAYRGKEVDPREIGAALGVRYLVKGSVRKMGQRVRITAELVSTEDGSQLWSEVYDIELADIFDIQDAMAKQVAAVIEPELATIEREIAFRKPPQNLDAWDCYQRGLWHMWAFTTPGLDEAEAMFKRAIELEPGLARAHAGLSYVYLQSTWHRDPSRRCELLQKAMASAKTAVALDERDALCRCVLGRAHCLAKHYEEAVAELEATIELNPSFAQGYFALAFALVWCGREDEAIALIEQAVELSPRDPHLPSFYNARAFAHFSLGELKSAAFFARKGTRMLNATYWPFATLTASLGLLGSERKPGRPPRSFSRASPTTAAPSPARTSSSAQTRPSSTVMRKGSPARASRPEPRCRGRLPRHEEGGSRHQRPRMRSKPTHAIESISLR